MPDATEGLEAWIAREFSGWGVATRAASDPAHPDEPYMSMAVAKDLVRKALAAHRAQPAPEGEIGEAADDIGNNVYVSGYHDGFMDGWLLGQGRDSYPDAEETREIHMLADSETVSDGWANCRDAYLRDLTPLLAQREQAGEPVKMLVDAEWLRKRTETDPDLECEISPPPPPAGETGWRPNAWDVLREANTERQLAWADGVDPGLMFHAVELGGEVGELLNVVKKLERERNGWRGSRATMQDLTDELADVIICADKLAACANIDLWPATVAKFNATSEKVGLPHRLALQTPVRG